MEHYFTRRPKSNINMRIIHEVVRGFSLSLYTGSSVFSPKKIDNGTRLLAERMIIPSKSKVLDLGCGYGVLGIVAKKVCPNCEVYMSDINERAIMLASMNAKLNNVKIKIRPGNLFEPWKNQKFNVVLLNPPMSAGKKICFDMIKGSYDHLEENGSLQIVVKYRKGGKIIQSEMEEVFGNVEVVARKSGYRILMSRKFKK